MFDLSFLIFLNALFLAVIGLLAQQDDKHPSRRRIWRYLGFFILCTSLLLGQEVKHREQSQQEEQREMAFQRHMTQLKEARERLRYEQELRAKTEELARKSDEIASLNRTIAGSVTGGDSFVYLSFAIEPNSNNASLSLTHRGKYPVFDVSIEIWDADEFDDRIRAMGLKDHSGPITREQMIALSERKATFSFPTVRPNIAMGVMNRWQLPIDKDRVRYRLAIYARNGIVSQSLNLQRVDGSWSQASRVFKSIPSKSERRLLYEFVNPDFPRNKQGKVVW